MVKHIVRGHRGAVDVESEPGKGSTFTIRLPQASEAA
jgi:signal transduction histidine kinase